MLNNKISIKYCHRQDEQQSSQPTSLSNCLMVIEGDWFKKVIIGLKCDLKQSNQSGQQGSTFRLVFSHVELTQ